MQVLGYPINPNVLASLSDAVSQKLLFCVNMHTDKSLWGEIIHRQMSKTCVHTEGRSIVKGDDITVLFIYLSENHNIE